MRTNPGVDRVRGDQAKPRRILRCLPPSRAPSVWSPNLIPSRPTPLASVNVTASQVMKLASKEEPSPPQGHMTAEDALELYALFEKNGIAVCVDGGWGVDALIGRQTRLHADLDIAIEHKDVPRVRELLEIRGYTDIARPDTRDCNFVLGDASGREVDVHSYTFDASGNLVYGIAYPPDSLMGTGTIDGHS